VSSDFVKRLRLQATQPSRNQVSRLSAADGYPLRVTGTVDLTLNIQGLKIPHTFHVVDNLNYNCILGIDFMSNTQAYIDFGNNTLSVCNDLVKTNLVPKKLSTNVLRVTSNCTIPPLSEAIIPVSNKRFPNG